MQCYSAVTAETFALLGLFLALSLSQHIRDDARTADKPCMPFGLCFFFFCVLLACLMIGTGCCRAFLTTISPTAPKVDLLVFGEKKDEAHREKKLSCFEAVLFPAVFPHSTSLAVRILLAKNLEWKLSVVRVLT